MRVRREHVVPQQSKMTSRRIRDPQAGATQKPRPASGVCPTKWCEPHEHDVGTRPDDLVDFGKLELQCDRARPEASIEDALEANARLRELDDVRVPQLAMTHDTTPAVDRDARTVATRIGTIHSEMVRGRASGEQHLAGRRHDLVVLVLRAPVSRSAASSLHG